MAEEKTVKPVEKKGEKAVETKEVKKTKETTVETKPNEGKETKTKVEENSIKSKKKQEEKIKKKDKAIANGFSLHISPKQTKCICKMITGKDPDTAIMMLEKVVLGKLPVKMTGLEVPHQKGKGISGARFPKTAAKVVADIVRQLKANALVNGIEEPIITIAMSNRASAPLRRGGRKSKRTHLHLEVEEKTKLIKNKK